MSKEPKKIRIDYNRINHIDNMKRYQVIKEIVNKNTSEKEK